MGVLPCNRQLTVTKQQKSETNKGGSPQLIGVERSAKQLRRHVIDALGNTGQRRKPTGLKAWHDYARHTACCARRMFTFAR